MKSAARGTAPTDSALELLDRSLHLLRRGGTPLASTWCVGSVPFVGGALFFWIDTTANPFASEHVLRLSLAMTLLYAWMKTWHSVFALRLRALAGRTPWRYPRPRTWARIAAAQMRVQPTGFLALPIAALVALPLGWVYAYYHSFALTGEHREASRQAMRGARQNHFLLTHVSLFSVFLFLNVLSGLIVAPILLDTLFGIETPMSRAPAVGFNSTTIAITLGLSYLVLSPLVRAAYVLRCFDGDSLRSGEDLLVELSELSGRADP